MLAPRAAYARLAHAPRAYVLSYVLFMSLLIAACGAFSATGRITLSQLASLSIIWMFVPLLHVLIARAVMGPQAGLFLMGHAPWSIWLILAALMTGSFGYAAYWWMLLAAALPVMLTFRIAHAFCIEVLGTARRGATVRALVHQAVTWLVAAIYLDRAVSLVPRIQGWLS